MYQELTNGCHSFHITLLPTAPTRNQRKSRPTWALPHVIITGEAGPLADVPPFPEGTTNGWRPPPDGGDKLLCATPTAAGPFEWK